MNSMEEEATQLESEVLRKILRQPKESAQQEGKKEIMKTATYTVGTALPLPALASRWTETVCYVGRAGGTKKERPQHPALPTGTRWSF